MPRYDFKRIEPKWQAFWDENRTFVTDDSPSDADKLYVLDMFPYPSGSGLHVGHPEGYTATDITCRFARMRGRNVLHPMGWDSFGLPAEEHAVKTGTHPRETTEKNIDTFRRQLKMLGFSYDWSRELATTDPGYYRWTQWIFLELFDTWYDAEHEWTGPDGRPRIGKGRPVAELPIPDDVQAKGDEAVRRYQDKHRLAYLSYAPVNWCPALGTVLANEEVIDGKSEVGGHPVERLPLRQWMLRITAYGDRLGAELEDVNWPDSIKLLQRNWIGRSTGAEVDFFIGGTQRGPGEKRGLTPSAAGSGEPASPAPTTSDQSKTTESPGSDPFSRQLVEEFQTWKTQRAASGFPAEAGDDVIRVYTTRPDTLFGATYMVLAPEHQFVPGLTTADQKSAVEDYCHKASLKSDMDRTELAKEKTGVFTGSYAVNPVNGNKIPIWIADYVLASYGTGAIMAVPAQDERDWEFAEIFDLPIVRTVQPPDGFDGKAFTGDGPAINSDYLDGMPVAEAKAFIIERLAGEGLGQGAVNYKLRDWLFSRQRYWGEPFPIWHELDANGDPTGLMRAEPVESLPVPHPHLDDFKPSGSPEPMLAKAPEDWLYKTEDGVRLKRETNSMPQWAGSCWYFLRFIDPKNDTAFINPEKEKYWMPVDLYIGGAEHAVLHLLYARFWHKVLFDRGHVSMPEPFRRLVNQGMILGEADPETGKAEKMSKSRGNVINPDDVVEDYGADSLRLYEMFMGPLEQVKPWSMKGVEGVYRFLGRAWRMITDERAEDPTLNSAVSESEPTTAQLKTLHKTIKAVTDDIEKLSFNTAISRMMEFVNAISQDEDRPRSIIEPFVLLLSPFAPHIAEELWRVLGHSTTLAYESWPDHDEQYLVEDQIEVPVQVNGKLRAKITVPAASDQAAMQSAAESNDAVRDQLRDKTVVKVIVVPGRMVNFVVR